ncbi:MAG: 2-amino-4-hydroxy-6-hydroxymethyldihydropteridine diphosphokinase [Phycisphaerae bacterium]|nr:2-amino-4-hydroxy-6-hydroxymethyldihydropteridine diphosphokinase [Phycisphaerae bacterium]
MAAFLGLGSNMGDRLTHMREAVRRLAAVPHVEIERVSSLYETAAVGGPADQGWFLNAVVAVRTRLSPSGLLQTCGRIERDLGRVRSERFGPRTMDVDVLLYADQIIRTAELTVPHPRLHERRFVLVPLVEVAPDVQHPTLGQSVSALLAALPVEDEVRRVAGPDWLR